MLGSRLQKDLEEPMHITVYFFMYRIRMYEHEGQWEKAVITYDIGLQQHSTDQEVDLLKVCGQAT